MKKNERLPRLYVLSGLLLCLLLVGGEALAQSGPLQYYAVTPCRLADTRGAGLPAATHPPTLSAAVPQNWAITGICGIPPGAQAVTVNFTATNTLGPGFLLVYPQGDTPPPVSTLNYLVNQTIANAAIVPLGTGGGITLVAGVSGTDLIMDVNGYFQ